MPPMRTPSTMAQRDTPDREREINQFYGERNVEAVILLKVDTQKADAIAEKLTELKPVQHAYLVTGEDDIVVKTVFQTYKELKDFIIKVLGPLDGIEDTKTMMIVTTYKENGKKVG
ncbi:MAG: Lrp/AsnC ligand binding domain-containing protein [Halobacteriales archaeon]|nr:Lrp/AsnC ligand binding domain-containing protein [Halobacteriales archaeon]